MSWMYAGFILLVLALLALLALELGFRATRKRAPVTESFHGVRFFARAGNVASREAGNPGAAGVVASSSRAEARPAPPRNTRLHA